MIAVLVKWPNKAVNYRIIIPLVLLPTTIQCQTIRQDTGWVSAGMRTGHHSFYKAEQVRND